MVEAIKKVFEDNYKDCYCSIKEIAFDENNKEYPIDKEYLFLDFDLKLVNRYFPKQGIKSIDTIDFQGDNINFIEFKNGDIKSQDKMAIKLKGIESLLTFFEIIKNKNIASDFKEIFNYNINYYVVLNKDKNSDYFNPIRDRLNFNEKLARLYPDYENTYFKKVEVLSFEQFKDFYLDKYYQKQKEVIL